MLSCCRDEDSAFRCGTHLQKLWPSAPLIGKAAESGTVKVGHNGTLAARESILFLSDLFVLILCLSNLYWNNEPQNQSTAIYFPRQKFPKVHSDPLVFFMAVMFSETFLEPQIFVSIWQGNQTMTWTKNVVCARRYEIGFLQVSWSDARVAIAGCFCDRPDASRVRHAGEEEKFRRSLLDAQHPLLVIHVHFLCRQSPPFWLWSLLDSVIFHSVGFCNPFLRQSNSQLRCLLLMGDRSGVAISPVVCYSSKTCV